MPQVNLTYEVSVKIDVNLEKLRQYLLDSGWIDKGPYGAYGRLFEHDKYFDVIVLPEMDTVVDFSTRIAQVLHALHRSEQRFMPDILSAIEAAYCSGGGYDL